MRHYIIRLFKKSDEVNSFPLMKSLTGEYTKWGHADQKKEGKNCPLFAIQLSLTPLLYYSSAFPPCPSRLLAGVLSGTGRN